MSVLLILPPPVQIEQINFLCRASNERQLLFLRLFSGISGKENNSCDAVCISSLNAGFAKQVRKVVLCAEHVGV